MIDAPEFLTDMRKTLPMQGPLRKTSENFVYVKVDNEYILKSLDFLKDAEAPAYFGQGSVGAHITVIDTEEAKKKRLVLPAIGTLVSFEIVELTKEDITTENGTKRVYRIRVRSSELEKIRQNNGFPSKDFHITVAIQYQ